MNNDFENIENERNDGIFSTSVKAGKRTYFFDVKATRNNELYITITERKRKFIEKTGGFEIEKHKIFLYPEDFENFMNGFNEALKYVSENKSFNK